MKSACVILAAALIAALGALWTQTTGNKRLETENAALGQTAGGLESRLKAEQATVATLRGKLAQLDAFGEADPRKISASFAKAVEDREVNVAVELSCDSEWQCAKEIKPGEKFPEGRAPVETGRDTVAFPPRQGMLLGVRSHAVFVLTAVKRELAMRLGPCPKPVSIVPKDNIFFHEDCSYLPTRSGVALHFRVRGGVNNWTNQEWTILHAWNRDDLTLLVIGCEDATVPSLDFFPYKSDRDWLEKIERKDVRYPVSQMNGCVSLIPTRFDRDYDHRGMRGRWAGFPESIHAVFLPIEDAPMPVLHSFILQMSDSDALWVPAWAEKRQLDAPLEQFDLGAFIKLRISGDAGSPRAVVWFPTPSVAVQRVKLLESYRSLMARAQAL